MPDPDRRFARLLAAIIAHAGGSEYALAKAAGVPEQTLAAIRRRGAVPRMDTVEKLLAAAGLSWGWVESALPKKPARGRKRT